VTGDTERKRRRTQQVELDFRSLLDAAVDAIIVIDNLGRVEEFSLAAERIFGYAADEVIGHNVKVLMPEPYHSEHDEYLERYNRTREPHIIGIGREVRARRKDGTEFPCELAVGQVAGVEPPRFVGFIRDITQRKLAEERLRQGEDEARSLQERLTHFSRLSTMGEMAAGLAHEINHTLAAIATYAQAGQRFIKSPQRNDADVLEALEQINAQALRAGEVIRRLRNFVKNREVKREPVECSRLLDDLRTLAETDARLHNVRLRIDASPDLPPIQADPIQHQQVVLNLVRNAIDAMVDAPQDRREVVLSAHLCPDGFVEVVVSDHGAGLAPDAAQQLFHPFFTTKATGTGLGLAISHSIVRAHGGRLWHTPNPGSGARFHFTLPVTLAPKGDQ
jgi:two-component system sensor kinase FixL